MASPTRPELVADTAIALLAERGLRGLTHRAVDEAAGLPAGSTSNLARTRSALLETAFARLVHLEAEALAPASALPPDGGRLTPEQVADAVAEQLHVTLTRRRVQTLARFEFALEATRRPELRAIYDAGGVAFRQPAEHLLAALGSTDPVRHSRSFIAWCEGVLFDSLAGAGARSVPSREDLRAGLLELLDGFRGA